MGIRHGPYSGAAIVIAALLVAASCSPAPSAPAGASPAATEATGVAAPASPAAPLPTAARSSRLIVTADALFAGHAASKTVSRLALPSGARAWQTTVGCEPGTLASSGARIYVACVDSGEVAVLDASSGSVLKRAVIGHGPFGLLLAGPRLYVTLEHDDTLVALDPETLAVQARAKTGREPRGLAIRSGVLYVVHYFDTSVRSYDPATLRQTGAGPDPTAGYVFAESITPSATASRLYVPHQRQMTPNMDRKFNNTVMPLVTALDLTGMEPVRREELGLDSIDVPVGLPIASVIDATGRIYVANAISSDISVIDLATAFVVSHILVGDHPRDLALSPDGARLFTLNVVSDDVTAVDTTTNAVVGTFPLAADPRPALEKRGQRLFMVSRPETLSKDRWMTCSSCHLDGGNDGQTWLGEPFGARNTPILRGIKGTQPFHWSGDFPKIQDVNPFIQGQLGGTGISDAELDALAAYIDSLQPLQSPARTADGKLTPEAVRGAAVFGGSGCAECHTGPQMTDRQLRDVGTGAPTIDNPLGGGKLAEKRGSAYKTPSLRELWLTAPYLHDGRARTLREVLTTYNAGDRHGKTSGLSDRDLSDLEAYLLSLPLRDSDKDQLRR